MSPSTLDEDPPRAGRAAPLPPEERRAAILEAVLPVLRERGVEATTRELAAAAGVAEGTLFRVFPDKKAIVRAAVALVIDPAPLVAELEGIGPDVDVRTAVRLAVGALQTRAQDVTTLLVLAHHTLVDDADRPGTPGARRPPGPDGRTPQDVVADALADLLDRHREQLRRPPAMCARILQAVVFASARPGVAGTAMPLTADELTELVLDGLLVAATTPTATRTQEATC